MESRSQLQRSRQIVIGCPNRARATKASERAVSEDSCHRRRYAEGCLQEANETSAEIFQRKGRIEVELTDEVRHS